MPKAFAVALRELPPRERAVLVLHDILDWDLSDVAELFDMRVDAVNCVVLRARAAIAGEVSPDAVVG
jgi:RNA polymerase sigma-70 factor (ECF subfamily)